MALASVVLTGILLAACGVQPSGLAPSSTPGWQQQDIGTVGVQGYMSEESGGQTLVVYGAGKDIWGTSDSFHFSYRKMDGDVSITARIDSVKKVANWTKAGVMIRASSAPDAPYAFVLLSAQNGTDMQVRTAAGATSTEPGSDAAPRPPYWVRLVRSGNTFTGYESPDGKTWKQLGAATVQMPSQVMVGLAVTSRSESQLANGVFTDLQLQGSLSSAPTNPPPATPAPPAPTGPTTTVRYQADSSLFPNPERGWYIEPTPGDYSGLYSSGYTLAMRYVRLDSYRNSALPASFLSSLKSDFASARGTGVKLVVRFAYNRSSGGADAPINIVLEQISQLAPILQQYSDVIAVVQAGFIGYWGEWHDSTNNLDTLTNRSKIANALLDALPASRMIEIRTPYRADDIFPTPPDASTAFNGSKASRVGQHNDCFLSSSNDWGTYQSSADRTYAKQVTTYTPMGGETCDNGGLNSYNTCSAAIQSMTAYHWDYLNASYWTSIYNRWKSDGCYNEISRRLGYRFALQQVTSPTTLAPGAQLGMSITMTNSGFGKLYNPRPLQLVFAPTSGGSSVAVTVSSDARRLLPLAGQTKTIDVKAVLPSGTPAGTYNVYLALPDASPNLAKDPKYSIRLANKNTWVASNGTNNLQLQVNVD